MTNTGFCKVDTKKITAQHFTFGCCHNIQSAEDLREIGINGLKWMQLAQDSVQWLALVTMGTN